MISGVVFFHYLKERFFVAKLPRCFTLLTPESHISFVHMEKALVVALNCKQQKNIPPMSVLECLVPLKLSGVIEVISERLRNIWFVRFG